MVASKVLRAAVSMVLVPFRASTSWLASSAPANFLIIASLILSLADGNWSKQRLSGPSSRQLRLRLWRRPCAALMSATAPRAFVIGSFAEIKKVPAAGAQSGGGSATS